MTKNDIGLMKLRQPIENVEYVKLPTESNALNTILHGSRMGAFGFGKTGHDNFTTSSRLRHVFLPLNRDWEGEPMTTFRAGGDGITTPPMATVVVHSCMKEFSTASPVLVMT